MEKMSSGDMIAVSGLLVVSSASLNLLLLAVLAVINAAQFKLPGPTAALNRASKTPPRVGDKAVAKSGAGAVPIAG